MSRTLYRVSVEFLPCPASLDISSAFGVGCFLFLQPWLQPTNPQTFVTVARFELQVAEGRFLTHGEGIQTIERSPSHTVLRLNTQIYIFKCSPHASGRPIARLPTFFRRMACQTHLRSSSKEPPATPPLCLRTA